MEILKVPGGFIILNGEAQEIKREQMEYSTIINELQDLLDRSLDNGGYDVTVFNSEEEALKQAIEAIHRLIDLEA